jgi:putative transposase
VHHGLAGSRLQARAAVLDAAFVDHPERFVAGRPRSQSQPVAVWINPPKASPASEDIQQ